MLGKSAVVLVFCGYVNGLSVSGPAPLPNGQNVGGGEAEEAGVRYYFGKELKN